MGRVYESLNLYLGKRVAIKVLDPALAQDPAATRRFLAEARAASSIEHPNVVQILDYGESHGAPYYVMEYLAGTDLERLLGPGGRLPWGSARPILLQIVRGLRAAHTAGIVHCDVKPSNVFVAEGRHGEPESVIKVLDFGIARASPTRIDGSSLIGTVTYMAPERTSPAPPDARADVYAMGVLMYRVLTGRVPFEHDDPHRVLTQHATERPPNLRRWAADVPAAAEAVVLQCLAKSPQLRLQDMRSLESALEAIGSTGERRVKPAIAVPRIAALGRIAPTQELGDAIGRPPAPPPKTEPAPAPVALEPQDRGLRLLMVLGVLFTLVLTGWYLLLTIEPSDDSDSSKPLPLRSLSKAKSEPPTPGPVIPTVTPEPEPEPNSEPPPPDPPPSATPPTHSTPPSKPAPRLELPPKSKPKPKPKSKSKPKSKPKSKSKPKLKPKPKPKLKPKPKSKPRHSPVHDARQIRRLIVDATRLCHGNGRASVLFVIGSDGRVARIHRRTDNAETNCLAHLVHKTRFSHGLRRTETLSFQAKP